MNVENGDDNVLQEGIAPRILEEVKTWPEVFQEIAMHEDPETQRRGLMAIANLMDADEKFCAEIVAVSWRLDDREDGR